MAWVYCGRSPSDTQLAYSKNKLRTLGPLKAPPMGLGQAAAPLEILIRPLQATVLQTHLFFDSLLYCCRHLAVGKSTPIWLQ